MDPVRLLDQPDLPAHERDALEAGRAHAPVAYDTATGAERLAKSLGAAGGSGTSGGATASAASQLGTKLLVSGVLASIAFVVSLQMTTPHESQGGAARSAAPVISVPPEPEMKAIAGAKRALSDDQPERALAILAGVARDYPEGYFIEERRALRVLALAADGESEQARREAASFLRDYPAGAFTQRVKAAGSQR